MKITIVCLIALLFSVECFTSKPIYQYRFETEDLVRSPTSIGPIHGYRMVQGGYYPYDMFNSGRRIGSKYDTFQNQFGEINGDGYSKGNQHFNDEEYNNNFGNSEGRFYNGETGSNQNHIGLQHSQGNLGSYNDYAAGRKNLENGEIYQGNKFVNNEGENSEEKKQKSYHRKGHVVKGFKNSHHKDETGEDEQHYDEEYDQGDAFNYIGNSGQFGESGENTYNGGTEDKFYRVDETARKGHTDNAQFIDRVNFDRNLFGRNNFLSNNQHIGSAGIDQQSLLGNQESMKEYKQYVPFFHH